MNPWDIVAWVGAIAAALVIAALAVSLVVSVVRGIKNPAARRTGRQIISRSDR